MAVIINTKTLQHSNEFSISNYELKNFLLQLASNLNDSMSSSITNTTNLATALINYIPKISSNDENLNIIIKN